MNRYLEDKRASFILIVICFITYTIICLTRNAYTAAIAGIINEGYFSKTDAGIIATSFNITYCISQIVGSYYVDKVSPFRIILLGSVVTIFANIVMSLKPTYWVIFISRGICGVAQFGIWPAMLRILSGYVNECHRRTWKYILPLGVSLGTIISYLCAAIVPEWRGLFTISYTSLAIAMVVFVITGKYAQKKAVVKISETKVSENAENRVGANSKGTLRLLGTSGLLLLLIPMFARNLVGGGIANWMPTIIMESYNVSPAISNIMTTISTCANFVSVLWVMILYPKVFKSQTTSVGMLFLFMLPFLAISMFIGSIPMLLVVVCIGIINTFNGAIHQFNTVEIPKEYTKYNMAGMVAGIINAVGTLSIVVSACLWGWMAETYTWDVILSVWIVIALVAAVCCFAITPLWKRFLKKD